MSVFKLYDIRGIYGKELTDELVEKIGYAFANFFEDFEVIGIGIDARIHSPKIKEKLIEGITREKDVLDFGYLTTPASAYLSLVYEIPVLMITASHNPPEYNGIKPFVHGRDLTPEELKRVEELTYSLSLPEKKEGKVEEEKTALEFYKWFLRKRFKKVKGYRIGFDPCNSVGALLEDVFRDLDNEVYVINKKLDGRFPNHLPDPSKPENLKQLQDLVLEKNLDFGIALDGDCDRVGIIDNKGRIFNSDKIVLAFLEKGKKYVLEVTQPLYLEKFAEEIGCEIIRCRTGRTFAKRIARENDAFMFSEYSGHFGFKDFFYIDDGIYAALKLIDWFQKKKIWFDDIYKKVPDFDFVRYDIEKKKDLIKELKEFALKNNLKIREIDGVEVIFDYGRILIRESQTEPLYRTAIECYNREKLNELKKIIEELTKIS